ncbi:MAG TPA: sugar phosphate isomerase/epimerase [Candidatus Eisenbergiella merdipullorum]|uniref:Sugar phosphate isomerase/epimerase n=1 Tax=Candidatus Eisenbergiella merdipullorum TaxID=2838553 RepID=A0A9D2I6Q7_9FIRM|nr:sugar phosphate isomerase/epimerase [Candidatus Eisenbergiella merdipullorum]
MWEEKIGLQLYSVRDDMQSDFAGTLKKVKEMGYTAVEFAGLYGHSPQEVKEMCAEAGLIPLSAHVPFVEMMADPEGVVKCYKQIGCQYIVIPYLTEEYRPGAEKFDEVIRGARVIGEAAAKEGMVLQYHNHDFEFTKINGEYALDVLYKEVDPKFLQTQIDTCWVNVAGEDPAAYVRKYAGRIPTVHLKDFAGAKSENMYALIGIDEDKKKDTGAFEFRPLGKGLQNIPEIVAASIESGAKWFIVEQDQPSMGLSPLECARVSVDYLKKVLADF